MLDEILLERYNKLPEWLRWIIFLPLSFILSFILGVSVDFIGKWIGGSTTILSILVSVISDVSFLVLIFDTVPRGKLKWVLSLIIIYSLRVAFLIIELIFIPSMRNLSYNQLFFRGLISGVITLVVSITLFIKSKFFDNLFNILIDLYNLINLYILIPLETILGTIPLYFIFRLTNLFKKTKADKEFSKRFLYIRAFTFPVIMAILIAFLIIVFNYSHSILIIAIVILGLYATSLNNIQSNLYEMNPLFIRATGRN